MAPLLDDARRRGYPTPNFLRWGEVEGRQYLFYDFIPGESVPGVTPTTLPLIVNLVELQADVRPDTEQDWSKYAYNVVFNNESGWAEILRRHGGVARNFMDDVDQACRNLADQVADEPGEEQGLTEEEAARLFQIAFDS